MAATTTSFRLSKTAKQRLADRPERDGTSNTALLEQLILEGVDALDHPGIVFRGPSHDRRAALAAGPDVWEVIARLRELEGGEEQRLAALAGETGLHPRQIRVAIEYGAERAQVIVCASNATTLRWRRADVLWGSARRCLRDRSPAGRDVSCRHG